MNDPCGPDPQIALIGGRCVLFVMALPDEYGPALAARIRPLMTGVGPVEAAITVTRALARLQTGAGLPDLVVSLGSAGSAVLDHCAVYQASAISWRDMDACALGFAPGQVPFLDQPPEITLPWRIPGVAVATLSTGGNVVSGAGYAAIPAEMVDMESYAVLRACQSFGVDFIALRGISDGKTGLSGLHDWTADLHLVDAALGQAVDALIGALREGGLIRAVGARE